MVLNLRQFELQNSSTPLGAITLIMASKEGGSYVPSDPGGSRRAIDGDARVDTEQ
jgi:hypothetical protein